MAPPPLRVVSYNVRYFSQPLRGLAGTKVAQRRIAERLASLDPPAEVVCLQEVESGSLRSHPAPWRAAPRRNQLESFLSELELAFAGRGTALPYRGFYFPGHAARVAQVAIASGGLGILVDSRRFRVVSHNAGEPHCLTGHRVDPLRGRRSCGHVHLVDGDGAALHVFNAHLSLPLPLPQVLFFGLPWRLGHAANQLDEARALTRFVKIRAGREPFLLCGDFNATPRSPVIRHLIEEAGFRPATSAAATPAGPRADPLATFSAGGVALHLDHLFCGGAASWLDLDGTHPVGARGAPFTGLSDHAPLIARLSLGAATSNG